MTGDDVDDILMGINSYLKKPATKQIRLAFEQSQKEVDDLRKRTSEGIETARQSGKQIGQKSGATLHIKKHSRDFRGTLTDGEVMKLIGISRNTYYKCNYSAPQSENLIGLT